MSPMQTNRLSISKISCPVTTLGNDLRRMLRMQFKEFIHHLEDCQSGVKRGSGRFMNKSLRTSCVPGYFN